MFYHHRTNCRHSGLHHLSILSSHVFHMQYTFNISSFYGMVTILNLDNKVNSKDNNCQEHKHYIMGGYAAPGPQGPPFSAISSPNLTVNIINFDNLTL